MQLKSGSLEMTLISTMNTAFILLQTGDSEN